MRKELNLFGLLLAGFFILTSLNNEVLAKDTEQTGPRFEFKQEENSYELGTLFVDELEPQTLEIEFENKGDAPLVLSRVRACCGTNVRSYPEDPIAPGETGIIEVNFRLAPRPHNINRSVVVMSNDPDGQKVLRIRGEVVERD